MRTIELKTDEEARFFVASTIAYAKGSKSGPRSSRLVSLALDIAAELVEGKAIA